MVRFSLQENARIICRDHFEVRFSKTFELRCEMAGRLPNIANIGIQYKISSQGRLIMRALGRKDFKV